MAMVFAASKKPPAENRLNPAGRIVRRITSLPMGQKLGLIYLIGIFLPLVIVNGLVLRSILQEAQDQEQAFILATIDSIKDSVAREFEPIERVSEFVFGDGAIYRILAGSFRVFKEFVEVYGAYLYPALTKYANVFSGITKMVVYTENRIVNVSAGYVGINAYVRSTQWYNDTILADGELVSLVHTDSDVRMVYEPTEYVSVFRKLDNPTLSTAGVLVLRIDVNMPVIIRHLESTGHTANLQLVDSQGNLAAETGHGMHIEDAFVFDSPFTDSNALAGWSLRGELAVSSGTETWTSKWTLLLIVSGLSVAVSSLFIFLLSRSLTSRMASLSRQMQKVEHEDFSPIELPDITHDEIGQLMVDYNIMAGKVDSLINDGYKAEIEAGRLMLARQQAELNALQSQVNPHYLYNALESIRMKSNIRGEHETAQVIKKLSRSFRRITSWQEDLVPLDDELAFTREYLEIQQYRFEDRLRSEFAVEPDAGAFLIPKLSVQELVENACIHGIEARPDGGTVRIIVTGNGDAVRISVSDDGVGCDAEVVRASMNDPPTDSRHLGIGNVWRRLQLHFGDDAELVFNSTMGIGTEVIVRIGAGNGGSETPDG